MIKYNQLLEDVFISIDVIVTTVHRNSSPKADGVYYSKSLLKNNLSILIESLEDLRRDLHRLETKYRKRRKQCLLNMAKSAIKLGRNEKERLFHLIEITKEEE